MRNRFIGITALLCVFASAPLASAATIYTQTSSSADTGGITAASGQTVTSSGGSASASVHTNISGNDSGGSADIKITTERNGVVQTETRHVESAAGEPLVVSVSATSSSGGGASVQKPSPAPTVVERAQQIAESVVTQVATAFGASTSISVVDAEATTTGLLRATGGATEALSGHWLTVMFDTVRSFFTSVFATVFFSG
ncbi:MAG TPA: hypothetical protein VJK53_01340 [Candidatus Paceibacterota bacterium]